MTNNIITVIIALVFISTVLVPLFKILKSSLSHFKKMKIKSKSGEIVELDLERKNDVNTVINFTDIFLGLK
ncbi:hypothetical protein [Chitinophaga sp. HK235]|uniref:hypothetical protein n=1 Tax=Chitinophaga sp. HK235 TaxID=2952571 RepID=UPI001BA5796B|nr:hypothetical protein [Chitinophaga sp. HK235]